MDRLASWRVWWVVFTSTSDDVERFLSACGVEGRSAYRRMLLADLVYPLVFGLFTASSLALAIRSVVRGRASLRALPAVALVGLVALLVAIGVRAVRARSRRRTADMMA